ncbi:MAG: thioredoxin family protein [Psychromonas sp.]|nr:thioredoxin family protein [Psychromonas sp.]
MNFFIKTFFVTALFVVSGLSVAQNYTQTTTGLLINNDHPPVSVEMQLTGQVDQAHKAVQALLNVNLDGDWKTYWRSPGEGGIAPALNWQKNSKNINSVDWFWPAPKRYVVLGVNTIGYKHHINFPLKIKVNDLNKEVLLKGVLTLPSCTNICVLTDYPIELRFTPSMLKVNSDVSFKYQKAKGTVPIVVTEDAINKAHENVNITHLETYWNNKTQQLTVQIDTNSAWKKADVFADIQDKNFKNVSFSVPTISIKGKRLTAKFTAKSWAGKVNLSSAIIHTTLISKNLSVEVISKPSLHMLKIKHDQASQNILKMFLFALLGGLILNIMPCVLPVLGMKLSSILGTHGIERTKIRRQFLASSAGIISSFWILAGFLLLVKLSGNALGWGIQFQNPYFIAAMVVITAVFAANMLGIFEIQLPSRLQTWLATRGDQSYIGHYLQGMFATLLATPCSAPFLGTAVAFALGASNYELVAIFTALGIGMSIPWLLIAAFPIIAQRLPKPGKWMNSIKIFFALMILATCLWLLSLMTIFIGLSKVLTIVTILLLTFFILIYRTHGKKLLYIIISLLIILCAATLSIRHLYENNRLAQKQIDLHWQVLDSKTIDQQVAAGKTVFVEVTADWCVTCKANEIGVIDQEPVYSALQANNIVLMKGDWTKPSTKVTQFLHRYGRYGVPFNIVYGPNAPKGIKLSTILSKKAVIDALNQAK